MTIMKRIDKTIPLPQYQTVGAVALDLAARETISIKPKEYQLVPLNVCIKIPKGHVAILAGRSSLFKRKHLILTNGIGVIDEDYCGNDDEYMASLFNMGTKTITIEKGERICQVFFVPITKELITEVNEMTNSSRGGFGTTGTH